MAPVGILLLALGLLWLSVTVASRTRSTRGVMQLAKGGREYTYTIGDDLPLGYGGYMKGIDIELPKEFPHVYLDSQRGGGRLAQLVIDDSQRISLEGDFDSYFQLYAPKRFEALALSVISPDVMSTILDSALPYDVELYGSHLRLISNRGVYGNAARKAVLLKAAEKVLAEVDQRLKSWSNEDSRRAAGEDLLIYPMHGIRLFGRFMTWQFLIIECIWLLLSGLFFWVGVMVTLVQHQPVVGGVVCIFAGGLLWLLTYLNQNGVKTTAFHSR